MPDLLVYVKGFEEKRKRVRFARKRLVIGRSEDCDMTLSHGTLSRQHLLFEEVDGQWFVEDMGSSNGTRLNGQKLAERKVLNDGDRIAAGRVRLVLAGLGGRKTSIWRRASDGATAPRQDSDDGMELGNLDYGSDDFLTSDELSEVEDDDLYGEEALDIDSHAGDEAEIELNTMIRSAMDTEHTEPPEPDRKKLAAWDDLFGEVDDEPDQQSSS